MGEDVSLFQSQAEEGRTQVIEQSPITFGNKVIILRPCSPTKCDKKVFLMWGQISRLGFQYYSISVLSKLGNYVWDSIIGS